MRSFTADPLLASARILILIARIAFIIGMVGVCIALAGIAIYSLGWIPDSLEISTDVPLTGFALSMIAAALVAAGVALFCSHDFVARLGEMIDTVGQGVPFTMENASRLTRMAWLALAVQIASFFAEMFGGIAEKRMDNGEFGFESDLSLTGIVLVLTLFILARVFRKGAEMRDELEGTV